MSMNESFSCGLACHQHALLGLLLLPIGGSFRNLTVYLYTIRIYILDVSDGFLCGSF